MKSRTSGKVSGLGRTSGTTGTVVCDGGIDGDGDGDEADEEDDEDAVCSVDSVDDDATGEEGILGRLAQCAAKTTWWKG